MILECEINCTLQFLVEFSFKMNMMKDFAHVSKEEQKTFINSFDQVFFDIDGVLWREYNPVPGASTCIENLKKLGKNVGFVSNNSSRPIEELQQTLHDRHFHVSQDDIVRPLETTVHYLKSLNIDKEIFVIGFATMREELQKAGFKLVPELPVISGNKVSAILEHCESNPNVGAVIFDGDIHINYFKLQKAYWYLRNPECVFVVTLNDKKSIVGPNHYLLGMSCFIEGLKELSGRDYTMTGKPSLILVNYLIKKFNILDPKRVLFVGDSIESDMATGTIGGFQKLLVLSGNATIKDIKNWQYPEEDKPDYYIKNLTLLNNIIESIYPDLKP